MVQELEVDPLKILQPLSKLQHMLELSSAYAGALDLPDEGGYTEEQLRLMSKQRSRMDATHKEPMVGSVGLSVGL